MFIWDIRVKIKYSRSLGSWCTKGGHESLTMQSGFIGSFDEPLNRVILDH